MNVRLLVATGNKGKLEELKRLFAEVDVDLVSLADVRIEQDVDEDQPTFHGNARKKSKVLAKRSGLLTLADDSGLEVDSLDGRPGVHSARYAGADATDAENNAKLLAELDGVHERAARFVCVLSLSTPQGSELAYTEGVCEGSIALAPRGANGFGYDPLFVPDDETRTMAELSPAEKGARSHRGQASRAMRDAIARLLAKGRIQ